ncbi:CRISPR-associated protein, Cmr3 [Thermocrinis albus DSM 14484]|uniref:CRISPR-associated protein, Cmr3 n=1 Tax=Thermocrinis albus (strain DSM 14484 / JCM 11386 / HI 11/12) TaxID=638303 RepID=D3SNA9_THEAH|nr:type III-B CRISPR module-associated Cmr3 family protein [Thermocrinis albus]ADC88646.1 CRISPR-associated protein, Cmr3 [Thermocrinis albus DSM 14484]
MRLVKIRGYNAFWFGGLKHFTEEEHYLPRIQLPNIMRTFRLLKKGTPCYGVFFWKEEEKDIFFPVPADVVGVRKKKRFESGDLRIAYYNGRIPEIDDKEKAYETLEQYFISSEKLSIGWAKGKQDSLEVFGAEEFFVAEDKVGLKLNKDRMSGEEKMLYFHKRMRLKKGVSLCFLAKELDDSAKRFFGGERNPVEIEESTDLPQHFKELLKERSVKRDKQYKFYTLTHTFVEGGLMKEEDEKILLVFRDEEGREVKFQLLWLFSRGSELISGRGKPALEMLKPGAVMILKAMEDAESFGSLCQIKSHPEGFNTFLERGWNTGILVEDIKGGN